MIIRNREIIKADTREEALRNLRSHLNKDEPDLVRFLRHTWRLQENAITYKSIREAIMAVRVTGGTESVSFFTGLMASWQQDYSKLVVEKIAPAWEKAARASASNVLGRIPGWQFSGFESGMRSWINSHTAEFVTNVTQTQISAMKHMVSRAAEYHELSVDTLAHAIRPTVGLTEPQAKANERYFRSMIEEGVPKEQALKRAAQYAERQHRYRAYEIARTELAYAYNYSADMAVREAQKEGYMGDVMKQWVTAYDERVCPSCGSLDGVMVAQNEPFEYKINATNTKQVDLAPAHPKCRCAVIYVEVTDPGVHLEDGEVIV